MRQRSRGEEGRDLRDGDKERESGGGGGGREEEKIKEIKLI